MTRLEAPDESAKLDVRIRAVESWRSVRLTVTNRPGDHQLDGYVIQVHDISDLQWAERRAETRNRQLAVLADVAAQALDGSDAGTLARTVVAAARTALACDGCELYHTTGTAPELTAGVGPGGIQLDRRSTTISGSALAAKATESGSTVYEVGGDLVVDSNAALAATAIAVPVRGSHGAEGALIMRSLSPRLAQESEVNFLNALAGQAALSSRRRGAEQDAFRRSRHDELTGLVNREVFIERLTTSIEHSAAEGELVAVLLLDIDHFKIVNDSLGHDMGDAMLESLSARLRGALRPGDTLARFGADEFVVLARRLGDAKHAVLAADRLQSVFTEPFTLGERAVKVTASVGVAVCDDATTDAGEVMRAADAALRHAKERGRARVETFDRAMLDAVVTRLETEGELRAALDNDEFRVLYHPIVDLGDGTTTGVEALVRWSHPTRGMLAPDDFLGIAEASNLVGEIGSWVFDAVTEAGTSVVRGWKPAHDLGQRIVAPTSRPVIHRRPPRRHHRERNRTIPHRCRGGRTGDDGRPCSVSRHVGIADRARHSSWH